ESSLLDRFLDGLSGNAAIKAWGMTEPEQRSGRFPTVSITDDRCSPKQLAGRLAEAGIYVWHGNYYALPLTERLGVEPEGMVRIGMVHYNTPGEVDRLLEQLNTAT
ncbi:MAG: aminotransferase class V-fold PLP-dependent enzyme, partial [Planctomycetota bacterium]